MYYTENDIEKIDKDTFLSMSDEQKYLVFQAAQGFTYALRIYRTRSNKLIKILDAIGIVYEEYKRTE